MLIMLMLMLYWGFQHLLTFLLLIPTTLASSKVKKLSGVLESNFECVSIFDQTINL